MSGFDSPAYKQVYTDLKAIMDPEEVRGKCFTESLINKDQRNMLATIKVDIEHNEKLLGLLEPSPPEVFAIFRDKVLATNEIDRYREIVTALTEAWTW